MRIAILPGLVLAFCGAACAASITNGNFEQPALVGGSYCINQHGSCGTVPGWMGSYHLADNPGAIANPSTAPDGSQYAMLQTDNVMYQSVFFDTVGVFTLSWWDAGRVLYGSAAGNQTYDVKIDDDVIGTYSTTTGRDWLARSVQFSVATTGNHTLAFVGLNPVTGDQSALLDGVSLASSAVPEPATIGVSVAAMIGLAAVRLRRR